MRHALKVFLLACLTPSLNFKRMGLDYTDGCVNFRDVGEFLNLITETVQFRKGVLLRGGSIDYVNSLSEIGNAESVFNLRNRADFGGLEVDYYHFPMSNKIEKYDTSQNEVKRWLNQILQTFENPDLKFPVLVHCLSGKDRTGIVIAAILLVLGVDKSVIKQEYLLSDGEVKEKWITTSIEGIGDVHLYFKGLYLEKIRRNLQHFLVR